MSLPKTNPGCATRLDGLNILLQYPIMLNSLAKRIGVVGDYSQRLAGFLNNYGRKGKYYVSLFMVCMYQMFSFFSVCSLKGSKRLHSVPLSITLHCLLSQRHLFSPFKEFVPSVLNIQKLPNPDLSQNLSSRVHLKAFVSSPCL